jgi:uncharacterized protein (TIGR02145 family)
MRKLTLSVILVLGLFIQLIAQVPQSFKYQAVVRDISGNIITNQAVTVRISILAKTETGTVVYSEVHNSTTNPFGTITLDIGKGTLDVTGNFADIKWGLDTFFLKLEVDTTGGTDFQFMGTSQLLSVPYALHARTTERFPGFTTEVRDTMANVAEGTFYYNTTTKAINFYNGTNWFELAGICQPVPTMADAGPDQIGVCASTTLAGNSPISGTGNWQIVSGTGGNIAEPTNPTSPFTGLEGNSYVLSWTITNSCTFTKDEVTITIVDPAVLAYAGADKISVPSPTTLAGNTPVNGTGEWTIISGIGGIIDNPTSPTSTFSGLANNSYTLRWTLTTACSSSNDDIQITFTTSAFNCGTSLTDYRDGKTYGTVLIGSQCWMAKNINVGNRIDGSTTMLNNGVIEKYCNNNLESNCEVYGGLYQWTEMMQYSTTPGTQGICTPGWHLPTDDEWKILEGTVDTQYGVGDPIWDLTGDRGLDAGGKLKATGTIYWVFPNTGANNSSGFTAVGAGARNTDGSFPGFQIYGRFWTSTESSTLAYRHVLNAGRADIARDAANKLFGLSVRCLKD